MKIHKGFKDIKVKVLNIDENLLEHAYMFGRFGRDSYKFPNKEYTKDDLEDFYDELINGVTFPKYCFEGTRIDFQIEGISRICLAQLTRDNAIFCSESHGLRPLSMDINLPLSITNDKQVMEKVVAAQRLLEEAYCIACEHELPYPETRYIGLHSQTISCNTAFTPMAFRRSCFSRTNNSFCDELNYVYRKMYNEVKNVVDAHCDTLNKQLWKWLLPEKVALTITITREQTYLTAILIGLNFQMDRINTFRHKTIGENPVGNLNLNVFTMKNLTC